MQDRRTRGRVRAAWTAALLGVLVLALGTGTVIAGKPVKPPPGPDPVDSGVIYALGSDDLVYGMDTDGTDRVSTGLLGIPSAGLHDGERWFLQLRESGGAYPSGYPRRELWAVTPTGTEVQLTADPNIEPNPLWNPKLRWGTDAGVTDGKASYLALRWAWNETTQGNEIAEHGIYVVTLDPTLLHDGSPHEPVAHGSGGGFLPVDIPVRVSAADPDVLNMKATYAWSPDGDAIAFNYEYQAAHSGLQVARAETGWASLFLTQSIYAYPAEPRWSADGLRIGFPSSRQVSGFPYAVHDIRTIAPDGSDERVLLTAGDRERLAMPAWSPSGDYLVCTVATYPRKAPKDGSVFPEAWDVRRAAADGSGVVDLTSDGDSSVIDWVADEEP